MAVKIYDSARPPKVVFRSIARKTVQQLQKNFRMQHIYPNNEVYPGFNQVNEAKKYIPNAWYSTGEGAKSFTFEVMDNSLENATIRFEFNDYLRYPDMGVGKDRPYEKVEHNQKANYKRRYVKIWDPKRGKTHRPAMMMEFRHAQGLMQRYMEDYWGIETSVKIYRTFSGIGAIQIDL